MTFSGKDGILDWGLWLILIALVFAYVWRAYNSKR